MKKIYFLLLALGLFNFADAQIINIPDANFKYWLVTASGTDTHRSQALDQNGNSLFIDANHDGEIQLSEAQMVYEFRMNCNACYSEIVSVEGIQNFTNLRKLDLDQNLINTINLSALSNLEVLYLAFNQLTTFDFSGLNNLKVFSIGKNNITSLNFPNMPYLWQVDISYNPLSSVNVSNLSALETLFVSHDNLNTINLSGLENLQTFFGTDNHLTSINLSGLKSLIDFRCENNQLTTLDVSDSKNLQTFNCHNNNLTQIFMKNGSFEQYMDFSNNPNLQYICADTNIANEIDAIQYYLNSFGYTNCAVNSYCSFNPGGTFYTMQGNQKFDSDNDGCDSADLPFPNLKYTVNDGSLTGNIISNASGNYSMSVQAGTHTITPVLENPSYFSVSPSSVNVTFPAQTSPVAQNFCVVPNGIKKDLEVVILPVVPSRPGFDAKFKIIYKNKGNVTQSGSVAMNFFDNVVDFVSSVPMISNQSFNHLTWDFTDLKPFEVREITFTVNINSPTETPPVNIGDVLSFETFIYPYVDDLLTSDNYSFIRQVVIGSYDPNDKTCLEGTTIAPDKVGEYVHYMIRFENTGTFPAENIVVKDMIDATKFDVNSLVPIKGSHDFVTRIDGDKVEFIFENINLPFDDANNDGYVAFKIKTKPTLVTGNTFSNSASIYFDYNFPIVTNTATTTIQALSIQDFNFSTYFNLYPNPVQDVLTISTKENIEITSINIYNTLGQLVLVIPNAKNAKTVDVSSLTSGNYFIKINSDKGTSNTKFIKN